MGFGAVVNGIESIYDGEWPEWKIGLRGDTTQCHPRDQDRRRAAGNRPAFHLRDRYQSAKLLLLVLFLSHQLTP